MKLLLLAGMILMSLATPWRWAALGDSLTRHENFDYPYLLQSDLWQLSNLAAPGSRLWDMVDEQMQQTVNGQASLVTVEIGINDILNPLVIPQSPTVPAGQYHEVLDWCIAVLRLTDPKRQIILGTVPPFAPFAAQQKVDAKRMAWGEHMRAAYNAAVVEIARRRECRLWHFPVLPADKLQADQIHPNVAGHQIIAASLRPLMPTGAGPAAPAVRWPTDGPLTMFPSAGPAGTTVFVRGDDLEGVKRIVFFPQSDKFQMCPVVLRSPRLLACSIPTQASGTLQLWATYTARPFRLAPNRLLGTFTVRAVPPPKVSRVDGLWMGVLRSADGQEMAVRLDVDQFLDQVSGRAVVASSSAMRGGAVSGTVRGKQVTLRWEPSLALQGILSDDERTLTGAAGTFRGRLQRW